MARRDNNKMIKLLTVRLWKTFSVSFLFRFHIIINPLLKNKQLKDTE